MNPPAIYIEISQTALKLLKNGEGMEASLEREATGRLTAACKAKVISALRSFLKKKAWQPKLRAYCAIGANGVSVRQLSLPATTSEADFQRVLMLQMEAEFPLPPDELAWGWRSLGESQNNGAPAKKEILLIAVKKDALEDYAEIFAAGELNAMFTLAALARTSANPTPVGSWAMLEVGRRTCELALFENANPRAVRVLPWGRDSFAAGEAELEAMARSIDGAVTGGKLLITGEAGLPKDLAAKLGGRLRNATQCALVETIAGEGRSATTLGLKKLAESSNGEEPLILRTKPKESSGPGSWSQPATRKLVLTAVCLLLGLLLLPFAEALVVKPFLVKKLAALKTDRGRLPLIDRELDFLQYLKQSQPPALDVLYVFAKSAPPGAKLESITMDRRGAISVRGSMQNGDQVADFRSKLIASGCFSMVTVEEQNPTADRQKVNVRFSAKTRTAAELAALPIGPSPEEIEKAKTAPKEGAGGPMPGGMPPGAMPSGMVIRGGKMP